MPSCLLVFSVGVWKNLLPSPRSNAARSGLINSGSSSASSPLGAGWRPSCRRGLARARTHGRRVWPGASAKADAKLANNRSSEFADIFLWKFYL